MLIQVSANPVSNWRHATPLVLILLAIALPAATRLFLGPPGAMVHVRWQPGLDATPRGNLERQFRLTEGLQLDGRTWRYNLADVSSDNIRAIVDHPAVEDTQDIDRPNYVITESATRTARAQRLSANGNLVVGIIDAASIALAGTAVLLFVTSAVTLRTRQRLGAFFWPFSRVASMAAGAVSLLSRGIPEITATTAGAFRIVFGVAVVWFFYWRPESASRLELTFNPLIEGELHAIVLEWMRGHPYFVDALAPWLLITGIAFTVGALTRLTYPLFVAGVVAWLFVATTHDSTHPNSTLGLTLVALLPSRWGDALSVDSWYRRGKSDDGAAGKRYGYSVWVPGVVFGVAFAAAAWAKLSGSPGWGDWILSGSVKYHFITDAHNAPLDWGLQLAAHPRLAVLASFVAVAVEALVITAAFSRSEWYRVSMGVAAVALLGGFRLFMGIYWPAWWIPLVGFLPWGRLSRSLTPAAPSVRLTNSPTWAQYAMLLILIGQQVVVSEMRIERSPMFTHYPMYSATYASSAQFDAAISPRYRIVVSTDHGNVELPCDAPENLVEDFRVALQGSSEATDRVWSAVRRCSREIGAARHVTLEGDRRVFDWEHLTFTTIRAADVLGPLASTPRTDAKRD